MKIFIILALVHQSLQTALVELDTGADTSKIKPCKGKDVKSCTVAKVNLAAFTDGELSVPECGNMVIKNQIQDGYSRNGAPDVAQSVAYENEAGCEAVFSYRRGKVFGNIDVGDGKDFVLEPCGAFPGCHVWKEEDTSKFVDGEGEVVPVGTRNMVSNRINDEYRQQGIDDSTTIVTFSIKFYYTREFADATDDIELYMDQVTAETNQGYINSLIPVRMKIHCIEAAEMNDIMDSSVLTTFRNLKSSVEELRGGADAAALISLDFNYCGIGYMDSWRYGWTLTAQQKACALGYYTMGHELGHNFGCAHDREHSSSGAYDYGFGQYIGDGPYRTCMAYSKSGYNRKANIFSSPVATLQGIITGSATEDNARVFRENRFAMAAVGDESGTCDWNFSSTAAPTTGAPTTAPPTTAPTTAPTSVPTSAPTTMPTTFAPNSTVTSFPPTNGPNSTITTFPTTVYPTTDYPTTTNGPTAGGCVVKQVIYLGQRVGKVTKTNSADACAKKCEGNKNCKAWTWFPNNKKIKKRQRRKCFLRKTIKKTKKTKLPGVVAAKVPCPN